MIIKPKSLPILILKGILYLLSWLLRRRFNKLIIRDIKLDPNASYLLMCNHFSFLDGFLAFYLCYNSNLNTSNFKGIFSMTLRKQMQLKPWLKYFGCFSVDPGKGSVAKSLDYAAEILNTPGNILLMFPQGNLESAHIRKIVMKDGVNNLIPKISGNCQIIWSSTLIEYFESIQPSVYFHLLDCGSSKQFDFIQLKEKINLHHQKSIESHFRFTEEHTSD